MKNVKIDPEKRSKALTALTLRGVVAAYIAYLAYKIASAKDTEMSRTLCYVLGGVFLAAAVLVGTYTYFRYRSALKDAEVIEEKTEAETSDEAESADDEE